ncbi:2-succinyl-6-hydroxy-2,4-cyclohexadiene-1-carboxylate synthase [Photobacterium sp. GB-3]|uniref:2-succinyl-6-hydroxy-2, 4-cyclohexadiene-1-carboxylate synthase n=1 Tax=Photobacterium sp. GB-3 TaxID=2022110 RepID=UPI000D15BC08|nr:2-succinyl-6-hydroxy-2,4-cyclohexadiene-1-carboxylate synthase [Photobacterium sp. GB-3]PSV58530.1 2-succinyl-6-hydroxy-2,4-cyclohexadiene-1-carboxylate synthase [Photobacterium sp. GB-3]
MRLYSEVFGKRPQAGQPVIVFLHGLLGSGRDWRLITSALMHHYCCVTIDLPGHGFSASVSMPLDDSDIGFKQSYQAILKTLEHRGIQRFVLVGYSLGARLAMYLATQLSNEDTTKRGPRLQGIFLEGGHFGLPLSDRAARLDNDKTWAARFSQQSLISVLNDWYQQTVFSSLNHDQRQSLVAKRSDNLGQGVANMLLATSLSKQPLLLTPLQNLKLPVRYVCGEYDAKFRQIAMQSELSVEVIPDAGHNIHVEQPHAFTSALSAFIQKL